MFEIFSINASGMEAQRLRMNTIASNLANAETTRTEGGGAYRRKDVVFSPEENTFGSFLEKSLGGYATGVKVVGVVEDSRPFKYVYDPGHPDADTSGYVAYPNVNIVEEMVNMINASRSYEANVTAYKASRDMMMKALEIGG